MNNMNESIILKYKEKNADELRALSHLKETGSYSNSKNDAQVMNAKDYITNGMIMVRKHPRFCYIKKHSHDYLEINYVLSGEIHEILDGEKVTLKQGELLFLSKNSQHEFLPAKEDDLLLNFIILPEFFDFLFPFIDTEGNLKKFLINLLSNKEESNSVIFHVGKNEQVQNIIENILLTYEEKDEKTNELLRQYFLILINELLRHAEYAEESKTSNYDSIILFKTFNYIENNYTEGSLKELAALLNEDYNYLSKRIKKLTGFSFQKLIENERIKACKVLLESTDANINDIAYHVGYNNLTFFYNLFKKHVGMSPLEYRNNKASN